MALDPVAAGPPPVDRMDGTPQRIVDVTSVVLGRAFCSPFAISSGSTSRLESVFVRLTVDGGAGIAGVGETTAMTAYTGETTVGIRDVIESVLAPAVTGHALFDLAGLHERMDKAVRGRSLAKAAIDMAVFDAQARTLGVPVAPLLGGQVRHAVQLAWVIGLGDISAVVDEAVSKADQGFTHIKVKGGMEPRRDLMLIQELSRCLPPSVQTSIDLNEGYDLPTAMSTLRRMQDAGLAMVEQPVPAWDVEGLRRLTRTLDLRVVADESLQSVHDALHLASRRACDIFNVKVLKVGGLYRARQVAAIAEAAGIPVKVGSMPELGVATIAAAHFAAATPCATVPADLVGPLLVERDVIDTTAFETPGVLALPTGPGCGVDAVEVMAAT